MIGFNIITFAEDLNLSFVDATLLCVDSGAPRFMTDNISFERAYIQNSNMSGIRFGASDATPGKNTAEQSAVQAKQRQALAE